MTPEIIKLYFPFRWQQTKCYLYTENKTEKITVFAFYKILTILNR